MVAIEICLQKSVSVVVETLPTATISFVNNAPYFTEFY